MGMFNGFSIDSTGRCTFNDTDAVANTYIGIPVTATGEAAVSQLGPVVNSNNRCGVNANSEIVYQDCATTPYSGPVYSNGGMPYTSSGALLCDSVAPIANYIGGLPFTSKGYLAVNGKPPTPLPPGKPTITDSSALGVDVNYEFLIGSAYPAIDKLEAHYINAASAVDQTVDITSSVYPIVGGYGVNTQLMPPGVWSISVRASNAAGAGPWSDPVQVTTKADPTVPLEVSFTPGVDMVTIVTTVSTVPATTIDYYDANFYNKTYDINLSDRYCVAQDIGGGKVQFVVPGIVGFSTDWLYDTDGWDVQYSAYAADGSISDISQKYTHTKAVLPRTGVTPQKANITSCTGTKDSFTVNFEPTAGETAVIDGWFVGVGRVTDDNTNYAWVFIPAASRTFTGKTYFNDDNEYGVCVIPHSATGGMSDDPAYATVTV